MQTSKPTWQGSTPKLILPQEPSPPPRILEGGRLPGQAVKKILNAAQESGELSTKTRLLIHPPTPTPIQFNADGITSGGGLGPSPLIQWTNPTTPGNLLIVCLGTNGGIIGATPAGWTLLGAQLGIGQAVNLYAKISSGESSAVFTMASAASSVYFCGEFSLGALTGVLDQQTGNAGVGSPGSTGTITTLQDAELVFGAVHASGDCSVFGGGFTVPAAWGAVFPGIGVANGCMGYLVQTAVGNQQMTSQEGGSPWAAIIASIK